MDKKAVIKLAKDKLYEIKGDLLELDSIRYQIEEIQARTEYRGLSYGDKVQTSKKSIDSLYDTKLSLNDILKEKEMKLLKKYRYYRYMIDTIKDGRCRTILGYKMGEGMPWKEIADKLDISIGHVHRLYNKALYEFGKKIIEKEKTKEDDNKE